MKQLELDLIITHPEGVTENLKSWLESAINSAAKELDCEISGSYTLVDALVEADAKQLSLPHYPTEFKTNKPRSNFKNSTGLDKP